MSHDITTPIGTRNGFRHATERNLHRGGTRNGFRHATERQDRSAHP
jgi:hypothetical protein